MDFLTFREQERGHFLRWPEGKPAEAFFVCRKSGCVIEHHHKRDIVARGEWRASKPFAGHASFHIWAAYSFSPNASWSQLATEFLEAKAGGREQLKTYVNTVLGETWKETGEAPDWERLYQRRETYAIGSVPEGVKFLTAGVDVQKDSWRYEVVGWSGREKESWSIDAGVIPGDTSEGGRRRPVAEARRAARPGVARTGGGRVPDPPSRHRLGVQYADGLQLGARQAHEPGHRLQGRLDCEDPNRLAIARGRDRARKEDGPGLQGLAGGNRHRQVGVLRVAPPGAPDGGGRRAAPGYCHFPEHGEDYFKQLTAEHLVSTVNRRGFRVYEWQVQPGRENHFLDCRVYARAAAALAGLDRHAAGRRMAQSAPPPCDAGPGGGGAPRDAPSPRPPARPGWLGRKSGSWMGRR